MVLAVYWTALCVGTHIPATAAGLPVQVSDKLIHSVAYAGLAFLLALVLPRLGLRRWRLYVMALLIAACYGALDELGQIPIPGRCADISDWYADVAGAVAGVALHWLAIRLVLDRVRIAWKGQKKPSPP